MALSKEFPAISRYVQSFLKPSVSFWKYMTSRYFILYLDHYLGFHANSSVFWYAGTSPKPKPISRLTVGREKISLNMCFFSILPLRCPANSEPGQSHGNRHSGECLATNQSSTDLSLWSCLTPGYPQYQESQESTGDLLWDKITI